MEIVLWCEEGKHQKVLQLLKSDETVSKTSIIFKEGSIIGKNGYYFYISGLSEACKKAIEITKDLVKVVEGDEKERVIDAIKKEESKALDGFGAILG